MQIHVKMKYMKHKSIFFYKEDTSFQIANILKNKHYISF